MLNLHAYLDRIGYSGSTDPSAETLRAIHRAHMLAVPFENLDIHLGRPIVCEEARFLHKIVNERRGGFCYELNGAFAALLRALEFHVTLLSARVARSDGSESPEFDHLTLLVNLPGVCPEGSHSGAPRSDPPWLADVGFGDSFLEPLRLVPDLEQRQIGRVYRLHEVEGVLHLEVGTGGKLGADGKVSTGDQWKRQYSFTLRPRQLSEFAEMCRYHQTSPESHFTRQRICTRATTEGRVTLSDWKLIETREGRREERELAGEQQWRATLRELFRVDLPG
jgi:N-hydroxyarylamine O-acetyltransferase